MDQSPATHVLESALAGLRVVDLSRVLGGPYCTMTLADHGAAVIKIEPPQGDETRTWGPPFKDGTASYFIGVNRNKRGMALDLAKPEGRAVLLRLLEQADVLIENFKPGTMEKWGIGYEATLRERFPRLIHCRVSGFGADGPLGGFPGYDAVVQAMAGMMSVNGTPESGATRLGVPIVDMASGLNAALGIVMAVLERQRSGKGQFLDVTLYDTAVGLLHPHAANWFLSGKTPGLIGNAHPNIAPYDKFPTGTGEVFFGIGNDRQFQRLCAELGRPDLAKDPRYLTVPLRNQNRAALKSELEALLTNHDGKALCERLLAEGVPAGPVLEIPEVIDHPHTRHRQMAVEQDGYRGTGVPIKMSRTPGRVRSVPPRFGADGRAVLAEAGYSQAEIEALVAAGILLETPKPAPQG
ncbi:MAG: CoA transferase [Proteobacteria bacterium]|nr:CoA transferase [Pseudomonadota bacterium]MBI3499102.1 CoA transferase [Pseudomonadota bacterium]